MTVMYRSRQSVPKLLVVVAAGGQNFMFTLRLCRGLGALYQIYINIHYEIIQ